MAAQEPRIETRAPCLLVGMWQASAASGDSAPLWRRFMPRHREIESRVGSDRIAMRVFHNAGEPLTPSSPCDEWAGVEVSEAANVPDGMQAFSLPGGRYAVFIHRGLPAAMAETARYIFGSWLPSSDYQLDSRPHLAVMGAAYRPDDPDAEEEIWIPIR